MDKNDADNCWDYWNCDISVRSKCSAFREKRGKDCWLVAGSASEWPLCPKLKREFASCLTCPWFKKLNG